MSGQKKVLILYITERSGHHSAARAIKKAIEQVDPAVQVHIVNAFRYAFPFLERLTHTLYLAVIKKVPKVWEKMYDNPKLVGRSKLIKKIIHALGVRRIHHLIRHFKSDVVICTQAFPCGLVADLKRKNPVYSKLPLMGVLTDFSPHAFWVYKQVDSYFVPTTESKDMLIQKGVDSSRIQVSGIPIDPKFSLQQNRIELLANYGLKEDIPTVMVMGGGRGLGPIKDVLYELDLSKRELQVIAVCGSNNELYSWIHRRRFKNRILSFRYSDQIDALMTMSNLIITKPGGITTAEALAKKLPMVILNPIPGQEARNTELLTKRGAAIKINKASEVLQAVDKILEVSIFKKGLYSIIESVVPLSKPSSSLDIARFVLNL